MSFLEFWRRLLRPLLVLSVLALLGASLLLLPLLFAVAKVIERLSLAFLEDGKLTKNEINAAFQQSVQLKNVKEEEETKA